MIGRAVSLFLASGALLALAACGEDEPELTEQAFCAEYARRECAQLDLHCTPATPCEPVRERACQETGTRARASARLFDPGAAGACLRKVTDVFRVIPVKPDRFAALETVCGDVYRGAAVRNEACREDLDCERGFICDKARCGLRRPVSPGAGCANVGEVCPRSEFCGSDGHGLRRCLDKRGVGMSCGADQPCLESLRCSAAGICEEQREAGAPCGSHADCATGLCEPYTNVCSVYLRFAHQSPTCLAYMGLLPVEAPSRAPTEP